MMIKKKSNKIVRRSRKSERKPKKDLEKSRVSWFFLFSVIVFLGGSLYVFLCAHVVDIVHITVEGSQRTDVRAIEDRARTVLNGAVFGCVRKSNFFFADTASITQRVLEDERIRAVHVYKIFPQTIHIAVVEHDTLPIWCVEKSGVCHLLHDGCVIRDVDMMSDLVQLNPHFIVMDHAHDALRVGECVISQSDLDTIAFFGNELIYAMDAKILEPYHVDLRGSREVKYFTDEGWYVLVDVTHPRNEVIDTAGIFMKKVIQMDQRKNIEYADFRFPEKIFYKMKNEESEDDMSRTDNIDDDAQEDQSQEKSKKPKAHD